jgi:hypothetical protein
MLSFFISFNSYLGGFEADWHHQSHAIKPAKEA